MGTDSWAVTEGWVAVTPVGLHSDVPLSQVRCHTQVDRQAAWGCVHWRLMLLMLLACMAVEALLEERGPAQLGHACAALCARGSVHIRSS